MIYEFPDASSPISQGDIFFNIPILELASDELSVIDDDGNAFSLSWEDFATQNNRVSGLVSVRPTIAIVGTQECDAIRAPNIALFEVRSFRDVERKSKDTNKPKSWVPLITQHARVNQKWFYLPEDEQVGFDEKMGVDFLTPISIPRLALERLLGFRKCRLNHVARQHLRERLAEFFRRYGYDEWYALNRDELSEYQKQYPDAKAFPWQTENYSSEIPAEVLETATSDAETTTASVSNSEKGIIDYQIDVEEAAEMLGTILGSITEEITAVGQKFSDHKIELDRLQNRLGGMKTKEKGKFFYAVALDMNKFSKRIEDVLPSFEENTKRLDAGYSAPVLFADPESENDVSEVWKLNNSLTGLLDIAVPAKASMIGFRDSTIGLNQRQLSQHINAATSRQTKALNGLISNRCSDKVRDGKAEHLGYS